MKDDDIIPADWPLDDIEKALGLTTEAPMSTDKLQISLTIGEDLFRALALDPKEHGAVQVTAALARYAEHVGRAARRVEEAIIRAEWNALADVLNGCADLWDYSETPFSHLLLIRACVEDGHRLDGLGYKWFGDGQAGDRGIRDLLCKLGKMTDLEGDAIAAAVRFFWMDARPGRGRIDHSTDEWWTLAYRTGKESASVPAD